ncbi:putative Arf/Sar family; other [Paratrimastix pyriformis]|uniref:Arf/Sar family n=1 Tax=Paratrimastix pyriformis TaxID=342808 RepID=A0ABQ8UMG8_9EUKA|nr:putative Arf/Sar family; other [Paratrimastix pyriformis]QXF29093.1 Arl18 [Paratrimastix pyriformis]|eukprot:GAFH01004041.1.p2 GENE.GAFH01004041.1~~GAFH01004041.1.p2  ORF type:complete len:190 (+),score=19.51 GAFH01004041.1:36-572(+)
MGALLAVAKRIFATKKLDVCILGLDNSGKTTILEAMCGTLQLKNTVPTIGMNVKQLKSNGVTMKAFDLGGQQRFRSEWLRYAAECDCILYVVDAADERRLPESRYEINRLLEDAGFAQKPILIVANKCDLPHMEPERIIQGLNLDYITDNRWAVVPISAMQRTRIPEVIKWLVGYAHN